MSLKTFTKLFYAFQFFFDFVFIYAVEKLFFLDRGLDLAQIAVLLFLWSAMSIILEVPSGAIADRWSRRKMLIVSGVFFAAGYVTWVFSHSFLLFLLGFFFRTLGSTASSGTLQAYVYDFLKVHKSEDLFEKILGRGEAIRAIGMSVAIAAGGFLSEISFGFTTLLSAFSVGVISIVALLMPEVPIKKSTEEASYWQFMKKATHYAFTHPKILRVIIFLMLVPAVTMNLEEFNDIYLSFLGYPLSAIGIIIAISFGIQSIGSFSAFRFKNHPWLYMKICAGISVITLALMATFPTKAMALALPVLAGLFGISLVVTQGVIQRETDSHNRATVTSASKLLLELMPMSLVFGLLANSYGLQFGYGVFAVFLLLYFVIDPIVKHIRQNSLAKHT